ncbi:hypothetical protein SD74_14345 [Clostridium botulinum]|nr:hypothetical protein SD74_14345 [Clostridium botulinum]
MQLVSLSGYNVRYRAYVGGRWLPWVTGNSDYAGIFGQPIEAIQAEIVSGNSGSGDMSQSKILKYNSSLSPEQQKLGHWCGSAAALNAVDCFYYNLSGKNTDKIKSDGSCYFRYMDSYSKNHGVYTVPLYTLANITYGSGLGPVCY